MLLKDYALRILRRLCVNHVGEPRQAVDVGIVVNHRDFPLGNPRDDKFVVNPNSDDRISRHEETLKAPADDLREAAKLMRASLCYGGSADLFYRTIADWFDREAGQAERRIAPGFPGVPDDLAVRAARAYLPGARVWLKDGGS